MFDRIVIGTANWGKEYNGSRLEKSEIKDILDYCTCNGITMLDTADEYESEEIIGELANSSFDIVTKGCGAIERQLNRLQRNAAYGYLYRTPELFSRSHIIPEATATGLSLYDVPSPGTGWGCKPQILQVPYSLMDRRFERSIRQWQCDGIEIHVRSVFLGGKAIDAANAHECLKFVLANRFIDKIVIGVDSLEQLRDNLAFIHGWNACQCDDETIIDPRTWKDEE